MKVTIETIPYLKQRYNTCGDWQFDDHGDLTIRVSHMKNTGWKGSMAVAVHELIEALLCRSNGVTTKMVDDFDLKFDVTQEHEPGDDPKCPCKKEHCIATGVERILINELGLDWFPYENELILMTEQYEDAKHRED